MLHIAFQIAIFEEKKNFTEKDVFREIIEKIIRRHPHVFGDLKTDDIKIINKNWEEIKSKEKGKESRSFAEQIPKNLPALQKAFKMTKKAAKLGFDWPNIANVFEKLDEELSELEDALKENNQKNIEEEIGDVFFMLVNLCRFLSINPETALYKTNQKFINRFNYIEKKLYEQGKNFEDSNLKEMDKLWEDVKKNKKL